MGDGDAEEWRDAEGLAERLMRLFRCRSDVVAREVARLLAGAS